MSFNAPPPPPPLLPPPPLPVQGLLPVPPPPPMNMMMQPPIPPPLPPVMGLQQQLQQLQPPPIPLSSSIRPSFQIVLINLPKQLQNNRSLRDWLSSCAGGSIRNVLFVPSPKRTTGSSTSTTVPPKTDTGTSKDPLHIIESLQSSALVTISNADSALKIIACYRYCKKKFISKLSENENDINTESELDNIVTDEIIETFQKLQIHAVPVHPDIPLPPAIFDTSTTQLLGDKLYYAYLLSLRQYNNNINNNNTMSQSRTNNNQLPSSTIVTNENIDPKKNIDSDDDDDDPQTNYGDDDDDDPLTTPIVLDAVQQFRINLEKLQGSKATRRKDLVLSKLNKAIPIVREKLLSEKQVQLSLQQQQQQQQPPLPLPSDLSGNLPQPPTLSVPLPAPTATGAPRGVSNLPAWMTQQQQQQQESEQINSELEQQQQPTSKRLKTEQVDTDNNIGSTSDTSTSIMVLETSIFPLLTNELLCNELHTFISNEIQQYLGVKEITLIDFIYQHIIKQKSVQLLLPELQQVVDDDAIVLLQSLWNKTIQLQQMQQRLQ